MECKFCKKILSSKSALNTHQKRTKYCLQIQGKNYEGTFKCEKCLKNFLHKSALIRHLDACIGTNQKLQNKIIVLEKEIEILREDKKNLQERYDNLSITAVKRPTTSNKNIQINNYIKNMSPLRIEDMKECVPQLTLEHHVKGIEGYAEYALEFPFKNKIVCVDVARNKIKYKNEEGDIVEDVGFKKMMVKLCDTIKDRSYDLSQEHYEKLSKEFTEKEMEEYDFHATALAISRCANGRETAVCKDIVNMISKSARIDLNV